MAAIVFFIETFLVAIGAGVFGALLSLGGGAIRVPGLTLGLGRDSHYAIGASIVAVIAASSGTVHRRNHRNERRNVAPRCVAGEGKINCLRCVDPPMGEV